MWLLHKHCLYLMTHTHPFNGRLSTTTLVSRYQKGKTSLDFTEARASDWQWHQLGAICRSAPCSRQITMPAPHHRPDALPATQPNVKAPKARAYMAMWMLIPEECVINLCSLLLYINSIDNIIKENCILRNPPALIAVSKGVIIKT